MSSRHIIALLIAVAAVALVPGTAHARGEEPPGMTAERSSPKVTKAPARCKRTARPNCRRPVGKPAARDAPLVIHYDNPGVGLVIDMRPRWVALPCTNATRAAEGYVWSMCGFNLVTGAGTIIDVAADIYYWNGSSWRYWYSL
jgi:hypothetical protein